MPERITDTQRRVIATFLADPDQPRYGVELMDLAEVRSGTLYPMLHRWVNAGWLVQAFEAESTVGGPRRMMYRLTDLGAREGQAALERPRSPRRRLLRR